MKKRNLFVVGGISIITIVVAVVVYFIFIMQPTSSELYRTAITKAINVKSESAYVSFDIDSGNSKLKGEFVGDLSGDNVRMRADIDVKTFSNGIPLTISAELIGISRDEKTDAYVRYKSVSTTDTKYAATIVNYFAPVIGKWENTSKGDKEEKKIPTTFESDGGVAIFNAIGIFAPISSLSDTDQKVYLSALDKYNIFNVDKEIEKAQFKGIDSRKLEVSVKKDAFTEFEKEVSQSLSAEAKYDRLDSKFVDQLFGKNDILRATVSVDNKGNIIGVEVKVDLEAAVTETSFNTTINSVEASVLVEYGRKMTIEAPKDAISEKEYNSLLGQ